MSRRSFLLELKEAGDLALWHDYRRGDARDLSGNANHGTASAGVKFGHNGAEFTADASVISGANSASLQFSALTIAVFGTFAHPKLNQVLIQKRDAGGLVFNFGISPSGNVIFYGSPAGTRILADAVEGYTYLAVNATNGGTPVGYREGILLGNFSGTATIPTDDAPIYIGNRYTTDLPAEDKIGAVVLVDRVLTATEHAKLYGELANQDWGQRVL